MKSIPLMGDTKPVFNDNGPTLPKTVFNDNEDTLPKTAEQITSTRKNRYGSPERCLIRDTMDSIYNHFPPDTKYDGIRSDLKRELDSLCYTAPEILGTAWLRIYNLLEYHIPLSSDKNPVWLQNIQMTWNDGSIKYKEIRNK